MKDLSNGLEAKNKMSQDIVADTLNQMTNALRAKKEEITVHRHSKFLLSVLAIAKLKGYIKNYKVKDRNLTIEFDKLNKCGAIKPRYTVTVGEIEEFIGRYLPSKNLGVLVVSTSKGLMTHQTAQDKNLGGSLIAYMY